MEVGASTPLFIGARVQNENLTSVEIDLLQGGTAYATVKLTNASISDYQQHGGSVTFSFTYQKIEWTTGGVSAEDDWAAPTT